MPTELALLPFIESAFNPQALSTADAAGLWQFVPGTGKDFNLKQNMFKDERRGVLASTAPRAIGRTRVLDEPSADPALLRLHLNEVAAGAAHDLRAAGLYAGSASVTIEYAGVLPAVHGVPLREHTALDEGLLPVIGALFDRLLRPDEHVRSIRVSLSGLVRGGRQLSLFPLADTRRARSRPDRPAPKLAVGW